MSNEQTTTGESISAVGLLLLIVFMVCFLIWMVLLTACYNIPAQYRTKPECNYVLPDNYKLYKEANSGKYAIYVQYWGYLYNTGFGTIVHGEEDEAELFTDSCKAKAYCHKCIIQNTPKHNFQQVK